MSRGRPAVFLDRDGTLIEDVGHIGCPEQVVFYPDAAEALRLLVQDLCLFIVTNQPGVAYGVITKKDVRDVNRFIVGRLAQQGVKIEQAYYCPHARADGCRCIKPNPYYLFKAAEDYGLDLARSFVIGDHPHDVEMARRAGATGLYLLTGHGTRHKEEVPADTLVFKGVLDAAQWIAARTAAG